MKSHQYARKLQTLADFLLSRPEFEADSGPTLYIYFGGDKERFVRAAKAVGSVTKTYTDHDFEVRPVGHPEIVIYANRACVCRKVQDEKWECEPLLSADEEAEIGGVTECPTCHSDDPAIVPMGCGDPWHKNPGGAE